jgi:hypothetical protein
MGWIDKGVKSIDWAVMTSKCSVRVFGNPIWKWLKGAVPVLCIETISLIIIKPPKVILIS